jgi:hypothetical protein
MGSPSFEVRRIAVLSPGHSRRALVAATAVLAAAPVATAKKKKGKKKPPAPLAYAVDIKSEWAGQTTAGVLMLQSTVTIFHPDSGYIATPSEVVSVTVTKFETEFAAKIRDFVVARLSEEGINVSADRVAVFRA